jgi:large subunit ribosomal protein L23
MADAKTNINLHILEPRATEKTYLEQTKRTYVFVVKRTMGKQEIAKMVEKEFNVKVTDVRTLVRDGKKTKFSKGKHAYPGITHRQDRKFAYVTLAEGNSIRVFDEPEKEDNKTSAKEAKKAEKAAKKADKNAGKENK